MSKPIDRALRRVCPDCGETAYGYPGSTKPTMGWYCRDTGEQIGCGFRGTSGPKFSADYIRQYQERAATLEQPEQGDENGQRDNSERDGGGSSIDGSGGRDEPDPKPAGKPKREQYVSPITG